MFGRTWVAVLGVGAVLLTPRTALAGEWRRPVDGRAVLAYAESWTDATGRACVHGGLDLEASPGADVRSCGAGRVAFAGRVPAAAGGTVLAVSVVTPDGLRVTYLPLAACTVATGADVSAGDRIGELAGSGDGSFALPHLHLSVRRGETHIDPATLLLDPAPAGPAVPSPAVGDGTPAPPALGTPAAAARATGGSSPGAVPGPVDVPVARPAPTRAGSTQGVRVPDGHGPRSDIRIRPLPYEPRFDVRAALARGREMASAGRGYAVRVLLALLAALLFAPIGRSALRGAAGVSGLAPEHARARRAR